MNVIHFFIYYVCYACNVKKIRLTGTVEPRYHGNPALTPPRLRPPHTQPPHPVFLFLPPPPLPFAVTPLRHCILAQTKAQPIINLFKELF